MKNLITSIALLAASSALASAATTTVDLVTLVGTDDAKLYLKGDYGTTSDLSTTLGGYSSGVVAASQSDVQTYLATLVNTYGTGFYAGNGTFGTGIMQGTSVGGSTYSSGDVTGSVSGFYLGGRTGYKGTWAAVVLEVADILELNSTATIDDLTTLTVSYTTSVDSYPVLTAWVFSSSTATELTISDDGTIDVSSVGESDTIVLLFSSSGTTSTTTNLSVTTTIPEPSTFGLLAGVGALALVASRRRRSRKA